MMANAFSEDIGKATGAASSMTIAGIAIGTAIGANTIAITIATSLKIAYDLIPSNRAAFPPRMARRSASLNPGVFNT